MACTSVVVDADNGIHLFLAKSSHKVVGTLLHLWVGTLNGIEFDATGVTTCLHTGDAAASKSDTIVVTTNDHNLLTLLRLFLQSVAFRAITYTTCQHDDLVVSINRTGAFFVLES